MAIDFALTPELQALQARIRAFIAEEIIPVDASGVLWRKEAKGGG